MASSNAPLHIGVDHQRDVRTKRFADGGHALDVFAQAFAANFHFDRSETGLKVFSLSVP